MGVLGRLFIAGPCPWIRGAHTVSQRVGKTSRAQCVREAQHAAAVLSQQKAWRCQSGPNSRTLTSAPRSPSIPRWESGLMVGNHARLLLAMPSCERRTPLSTHHALPDISPTSPPDRRPLTQPKNSTSFFFFERWVRLRIGLLKPRGTATEICVARICERVEATPIAPRVEHSDSVITNGLQGWQGIAPCEKPLGRRSHHESKRQPTSLLMGQWFDRKGGRVTKESSSSNHWFKSLCRGFSFFF